MYSAIDLSKYIVTKCVMDEQPVSNLQLQKILFYIQKEYLSQNRRAFIDEIEAWQFGPVVPAVYYRFCGFGAMPITLTYTHRTTIDTQDKAIIDPIIEEKRSMNPWDLVNETHKPSGAWSRIYENGVGNHRVIPIELIKAVG